MMTYNYEPRRELEAQQATILKKHGAFFAFSNEEIEEKRDPNIPFDGYVKVGYTGTVVPLQNAPALVQDVADSHTEYRKKNLEVNGQHAVILYELENYECFLTCDLEPAIDALSSYGFTREEIESVFDAEYAAHCS